METPNPDDEEILSFYAASRARIRAEFPTPATVIEKYEQNKSRGKALYMAVAFLRDYEYDFLCADAIGYGSTHLFYTFISALQHERESLNARDFNLVANKALLTAASMLDEPLLLIMLRIWDPTFVLLKGDGANKKACHSTTRETMAEFENRGAKRCKAQWERMAGGLPSPIPCPPTNHVPCITKYRNSTRREEIIHTSLRFQPHIERAKMWQSLNNLKTIKMAQFKGLPNFNITKAFDAIVNSLFRSGFTLLESSGLRFAFVDEWSVEVSEFKRQCHLASAAANTVLVWARRMLDPGQGIFLFHDGGEDPHIADQIPLDPPLHKKSRPRAVTEAMKREMLSGHKPI